MIFIQRLSVKGLLSFPHDTEPLELRPLNVLIGPNGSGKSNVIEVLELLRATSTDFAAAIRDGGGASEWLWKGDARNNTAAIEVYTGDTDSGLLTPTDRSLRYLLEFTSINSRVEVLDEAIEDVETESGLTDPSFYYRFQKGQPVIKVNQIPFNDDFAFFDLFNERTIKREDLLLDQSVMAQRKEPDLYPEVTWLGSTFGKMQIFRDWTFGRYTDLRKPQPADLPNDSLLPDSRNLALLLNNLMHHDPGRFNELLKKFFPRFERMSINISGGSVQFFLHESGFNSPVPSTRLSDGTIRFIAILATLLAPDPPPLVCIEEPELGMHPDAVSLIGELLVEASERMQLIVTTHSDSLVSALSQDPESVITCERLGGSTKLNRLNYKELAHWLNDYGLGDLWRMGELGANP